MSKGPDSHECMHGRDVMRTRAVVLVAFLLVAGSVHGQGVSDQIRINQVGFHPLAAKGAVVVGAPTNVFQIKDPALVNTVFEGVMTTPRLWVSSQEDHIRIADFSGFTQPGTWVFVVPGMGTSPAFVVENTAMEEVATAAIKAFYFQRASLELRSDFAGPWARRLGHPDNAVLVHASAATDARPEGTVISSSKGWYDAGDYNKYVVNSGITTAQLLMLYERFPEYFSALELNIPESGNGIPDILDEVLWNLRWMMTMQDPYDGGVYHKLTTENFAGFVRPYQATAPRYVVQKSSPATLDFAAVSALAARIFADFPAQLPGLSDSLLEAASRAWDWAQENPDEYYVQWRVNSQFDPDINTGEYGDGSSWDEFGWAASELYLTTRADSFLVLHPPDLEDRATVPGWNSVSAMGLASLALYRDEIALKVDTTALRNAILLTVNQLVEGKRNSPYGVGIGNAMNEFYWGSNSLAANQGFLALVGYEWKTDQRYLDLAVANIDYLLGRNATGYSFVTGYGSKTPMHPHHRPSQSDGVVQPIPGLLVGGPNGGREDGCTYPYPANAPARSYVDDVCSYASNEIAINWQSSLAFLTGAVAAILSPDGLPTATNLAQEPVAVPIASVFEFWPNPVSDVGHVRFDAERDDALNIEVYDVLGRRVHRMDAGRLAMEGMQQFELDTSDLSPGPYWLVLRGGLSARSHAFVVAR